MECHKVVTREEVARGNSRMQLWLRAPKLLQQMQEIAAYMDDRRPDYFPLPEVVRQMAHDAIAEAKGE